MHFPLPKVNQHPFETADSSSEQLYALHASAIFAYVRLYVASREVAEDLVIDVFLAALEHSYLLARSEEIQRAWLRKVAHYKIIDYYRLQRARSLSCSQRRVHFCYNHRHTMIGLLLLNCLIQVTIYLLLSKELEVGKMFPRLWD